MLPNFIGIGAPKAGTTWLFRCLQEHSQVFVAACKETKFFDEEVITGRIAEYEKHFLDANGAIAVGEISTRYLNSSRAPQRVSELLPNVRLFVSLRNPIEQVYSHYWHLRRQNFHESGRSNSFISFEEALEVYENRLIAPAFYCRCLRRWLEYFDRSQLLIIFYDDICSDPQNVLRCLYSFLTVDDSFEPRSIRETGPSVRQGAAPRNLASARFHSFLYSQLTRRIYYPLKQYVGSWTADKVKEFIRIRPIMESVFMEKGYPEMKRETRERLYELFVTDMKELELITGRDLSNWQ